MNMAEVFGWIKVAALPIGLATIAIVAVVSLASIIFEGILDLWES